MTAKRTAHPRAGGFSDLLNAFEGLPRTSADTSADRPSDTSADTPSETPAGEPRPLEPRALQLLAPDGTLVTHRGFASDHTPDQLRDFYRDMVMSRAIDGEATALQRQGELGLWPPLLGQEAAQVGSAQALRGDDYAFPSYREHGVAWCRGVDPVDVVKLFRGVSNGGWDPNEHNFHLYTLVVGSHPLHATGYAMGLAQDGADAAVIAYFGDGATSEGDVAEAFTFATVHDAPVVFFCQNNQWAISEPVERQLRGALYRRAQGYGFPGIQVDGNDVLAVHAVTRAALEHVRTGNGPVLIEASTYRMGAHTTSDDPSRYRRAAEVEEWRAKDPIQRLRTHLVRDELATQEFFDAVDAEATEVAYRIRRSVRTMPNPDRMTLFDHVYADGHALVDEERAQFAAYQASFVGSEVK
ncbi:pyruvate dehydrogenase (acetyl-transferring) E1 component subunit alpha [Streptomyces sp. ADMS]|uniref:pyruvate dehydrogenase (acetyl-transferring) E1 component subunit alpha n=1 Tax=Streptomyces sp. ADMS TaxID=3071415 RepID=UPI00296FDC1C|nr:pyruvate dehydrogenase (acetyl-transferring) E1 component subunit alpha [Streptomyces sp. ADMS]MDW4905799.1 pyruvate dehydrogenase (acetyl-transferring) E1 component subunit alpha [Streptomyces sp. ADMS]